MVTPQMLDYIRKQLSAGVSGDTIRTNLAAQRWSGEDIQSAFKQLQQPSGSRPSEFWPMDRVKAVIRSRLFWYIVIGAIVVAAVITVLVLSRKGLPVRSPQPQPVFVTPKAESTTGFYTYTSTTSNFSIRYPKDWKLIKTPPACDLCTERFILGQSAGSREDGYVADDTNVLVQITKSDVDTTFDQKDQILQADKGVSQIAYLIIGGERAVSYATKDKSVLKRYWVLHKDFEYTLVVYKSPLYRSDPQDYVNKINVLTSSIQFTK